MADVAIGASQVAAAPLTYKIPGGLEVLVKCLSASFDGTGAGSAWQPAIQVIGPAGTAVGTFPVSSTVAAGASVDVSWFPGLGGTATTTTVSGKELDYVEITATVTVATGGSGTMTTCITGNAVVYDGLTRVRVECFTPTFDFQSNNLRVDLFEDATDLAIWGDSDIAGVVVTDAGHPGLMVRYLTPTAGSHTFSVKGWTTGGTPALFGAGPGTGGFAAYMPAYLRVSVA